MNATFHLSIGVRSLPESVVFYTDTLGAKVALDNTAAGYVNLELASVQLTLQQREEPALDDRQLHFGINTDIAAFDALARHVAERQPECIVSPPAVIDAGSAHERKKMRLRCPSGYLIEIKGYAPATGKE